MFQVNNKNILNKEMLPRKYQKLIATLLMFSLDRKIIIWRFYHLYKLHPELSMINKQCGRFTILVPPVNYLT